MKNGQLPTWFVVKWLSVNWHHTAKAPNTDDFWPCKASTDGMHVAFLTKWPPEYEWNEDGSPPNRNDWTICHADGKPVRFKRKPKMEHVGEISEFETLAVDDGSDGLSGLAYADQGESFDVYVRQKKGRK